MKLFMLLSIALPCMRMPANFLSIFYFSLARINPIMLHYPGKEDMT